MAGSGGSGGCGLTRTIRRSPWISHSDQARIGRTDEYACLITPTPSEADPHRPFRLPVAVGQGQIVADRTTASFVEHDSASLLRNYLRLIRSLRHQERAPEVVLRRDDIEVLAKYLEEPEESVLDRLAALMGATRTQRTAMLSLFASGALLIGLSSSVAAAPAASSQPDGSRPPGSPAGPAATLVVAGLPPLLPGDTVIVTTVATPPAGVVGVGATVSTTAVEIATTTVVEVTPTVATSPRAVVAPSPAPTAPPTTEQPLDDVAAVAPVAAPTVTTEPVVVGVGEPPIAPDAPFIDPGTPPLLPEPVTSTTTLTTSTTPASPTSSPTSPGGVGEPPLDEPTTTTVDPSTVAVDLPPVPTTAGSTTIVESTEAIGTEP